MINVDLIETNLVKALNKHWVDNADEENFYFEGQKRTTNVLQRYIEVKYFGPFFDDDDTVNGVTTVSIQVHLDCFVAGSNIYDLNKLTGKMVAIARLPIAVEEFGDCLERQGIRVLPKGQVGPKEEFKCSLVEVDYSIDLEL